MVRQTELAIPLPVVLVCTSLSIVSGNRGQPDGSALVDSAFVEEIACCCREDDDDEVGSGIREKELMAEEG